MLVTSKLMRQIDQDTIEQFGIPEMVLMENAGRQACEQIVKLAATQSTHPQASTQSRKWLILVGKGNNGGDGLVIARYLLEIGHQPTVLYAISPEQLKGSAARQRNIIEQLAIPTTTYPAEELHWQSYDGVIDCLLGTGSSGRPKEPFAAIIREANQSQKPIYALDIPSGLHADTGEVYEPCIQAVATIALALFKIGHALYPGKQQCGQIVCCEIGIPKAVVERHLSAINTYLIDEKLIKNRIPRWHTARPSDSHKGTYGHVYIAAGSLQYSGAGLLCAQAANKIGCGLVTWSLPERINLSMLGHAPEVIISSEHDSGTGSWEHIDPSVLHENAMHKQSMVLGCGLGRFEQDHQWILKLVNNIKCPLVLDADALNMLAEAEFTAKTWNKRTLPTIITPHPGEMARLLNVSTEDVQRNRLDSASSYSHENNVIVVLKGAATVIADPAGAQYINSSGNPYMAVGGMGDLLAGLIGGIGAQGYTAIEACLIAVYYHGAWADQIVQSQHNPVSLTPSQLLQHIGSTPKCN